VAKPLISLLKTSFLLEKYLKSVLFFGLKNGIYLLITLFFYLCAPQLGES